MAKMSVNHEETKLDAMVLQTIGGLIGQACCRQRVGRMRSLSLGFGQKIPHGKPRLVDNFYGEWEIGTYTAAWRVVHEGVILCGSQDVVDSLSDLDQRLSKIKFGEIKAITAISKFDIRLHFDGGMHLDCIGAASEHDELLHIFCPEKLCVEYSIAGGWKVGPSSR